MNISKKISVPLTIVFAFCLLATTKAIAPGEKISKASVYPNPVTSDIIQISSDKNIQTVEILNVIGKSVQRTKAFSEKKVEVPVEIKEKGMYLLKVIYTDKTEYIQRIIIK